MTESELTDLVGRLAAGDEWRGLVHRDPDRRRFEPLSRTDDVDVWVLSWMHEHDTGWHDHDISSGAVAVVVGEIVEERLRIGGSHLRRTYAAGTSFSFDPSHVHRIHNETQALAVSIHAYSPPLAQMGSYTVDDDGALRRFLLSGDEELMPAAVS